MCTLNQKGTNECVEQREREGGGRWLSLREERELRLGIEHGCGDGVFVISVVSLEMMVWGMDFAIPNCT